jgi:hypothetical protein
MKILANAFVASFFLAIWLFPMKASADCICRCVDGQMRAICGNALSLPPICPATLCPITPPSLAPLPSLGLPPLGTTTCRQAQVFNPRTGFHEWRQVCS